MEARRIVVDASFAGAWIVPDEFNPQAETILSKIEGGEFDFCSPELWSYEMSNLILVSERRGRLNPSQVFNACKILTNTHKSTFGHDTPAIQERLIRFGKEHQLSGYDAAYLELADRLQAPLLTMDKRLAAASEVIDLPPFV